MDETGARQARRPTEIDGWECRWEESDQRLELWIRRRDRRSAAVGEPVAGRIEITREAVGWTIQARFWVLEDLAEHQRLRVRSRRARSLDEVREFLLDGRIPEVVTQALVTALANSQPAA